MKVGITGQSGFIGSHLYNLLGTLTGEFERIEFKDEFFKDSAALESFVRKCDVIVHLAAVNRNDDPEKLYMINIELVVKLIHAMEKEKVSPHVIFSSSIQEALDNSYGNSKCVGRRLLDDWARRNNATFTGCVIPNVFGPFGRPNYNSVIATFCYKLTHNEQPEIRSDASLRLIYVGELCADIINIMRNGTYNQALLIPHRAEVKVTELLSKLISFKEQYLHKGIFPKLEKSFDIQLFNTFTSFINFDERYPFILTEHCDERGRFIEMVKLDQLGGQVSFSTTKPGITRGNHYHTRKIERFIVIKGKAKIELQRIGSNTKHIFELCGNKPSFVDIPIWYSHNITNIGNDELYTVFWINELYNQEDTDTFLK